MDEFNYDRLAYALSQGEWLSPALSYCLPLYPALLALGYGIVGRNLFWVRILQLLLGTASCGLTYLVGKNILGKGKGLLAALFLALYGTAILHETLILPTSLAIFTGLLVLIWLSTPRTGDHLRVWFVGGILVGLSGLAAASHLLLAAGLVCFWKPRSGGEGRTRSLWPRRAALISGLLVILGVISARNYLAVGDIIPLSAHGGINYYLGNNPEANGGYLTPSILTPSATGIIRDSRRIANLTTHKNLSPAQVSAFWFRKGFAFIFNNPGEMAGLWSKKILLFFSPWEYCDIGDLPEKSCNDVRLFGIPLLKFSWLAPLILGGLFLSYRQRRKMLILYLFAGAHVIGVTAFFYQARARLLLLPVFALWAAMEATWGRK